MVSSRELNPNSYLGLGPSAVAQAPSLLYRMFPNLRGGRARERTPETNPKGASGHGRGADGLAKRVKA